MAYKGKMTDFEAFVVPYLRSLQRRKKYSHRTIEEIVHPDSEEISYDLIQRVLEHIRATDSRNGAVLIFLPGWDTISALMKHLESSGKFPANQFKFYPLHSQLPTLNQREVFSRAPPGMRKVIIATNIAETSIVRLLHDVFLKLPFKLEKT
jgi:HrpA-like RNA helicase